MLDKRIHASREGMRQVTVSSVPAMGNGGKFKDIFMYIKQNSSRHCFDKYINYPWQMPYGVMMMIVMTTVIIIIFKRSDIN